MKENQELRDQVKSLETSPIQEESKNSKTVSFADGQEIEPLQSNYNKILKENKTLLTQVKNLQQELSEQKPRIFTPTKTDEDAGSLETIQKELEEANSHVIQLSKEVADKEVQIATLSAEVARLQDRESKLKDDIERTRKLLDAEKENNTKAQISNEVQKKMESYLTEITVLKAEETEKASQLLQQESEISSLKALVEQLDPKGKKRKKKSKK